MKYCSICNQNLPLSAFDKQTTGAQGRRADCKDCRKRFDRSRSGLVKKLFQNQKRKSRLRGHPAPAYTESELSQWLWKQPNARHLYDKWVESNYETAHKPSVDRLDDNQPYTISNIRLVTWETNRRRYYTDAQNGINVKNCEAVDQYTLEGEFIQSFHSYSAAARAVNGYVSNIRSVALGLCINRQDPNGSWRSYVPQKHKGFIWKKP